LIQSLKPELKEINGDKGCILGLNQGGIGIWYYAVSMFKDDECRHIEEMDIVSQDRFLKREDYYDGSTVTVAVDKKCRGKILND